MDDQIFIRGLALEATIGVHAYEQPLRQRLFLDIEIAVDLAPAAASGRLADTIDYKAVAEALQALAQERSYALVETFAEAAARLILDGYGARRVRIALTKPGAVRGVSSVGVVLERAREFPTV